MGGRRTLERTALVVAVTVAAAVVGSFTTREGAGCGQRAFVSLTVGSNASGYPTMEEAANAALLQSEIVEGRALDHGGALSPSAGGGYDLIMQDGQGVHLGGGPTKGGGWLFTTVTTCVGAPGVTWARGGNPCDLLAERHLLDAITLHGIDGLRPSMEEAVEVAFGDAGMAREIKPADLDPVVYGRGNVVHVGVHGYSVMLATVGDGFVPVDPPRPCSALSEGEQT